MRNLQRKTKRSDPKYSQKETALKHASRPKNLEELVQEFHRKLKNGPVFVCSSCEQLWYRHSVVEKNNSSFLKDNKMATKCLQGIISVKDKEWVCLTCLGHLKKGEMPPCAIANNMAFPPIPKELQGLHKLESRLLAPRLAFIKMYAAPCGGQYKIRGNVVNVVADTSSTIASLPRVKDKTRTIKVELKRQLKYKHSVMSENVRPEKVREAAKYLCMNSSLFAEHGITYDPSWKYQEEKEPTVPTGRFTCTI